MPQGVAGVGLVRRCLARLPARPCSPFLRDGLGTASTACAVRGWRNSWAVEETGLDPVGRLSYSPPLIAHGPSRWPAGRSKDNRRTTWFGPAPGTAPAVLRTSEQAPSARTPAARFVQVSGASVQSLPETDGVLCPPGTHLFRGLFLRAGCGRSAAGLCAVHIVRLGGFPGVGVQGRAAVAVDLQQQATTLASKRPVRDVRRRTALRHRTERLPRDGPWARMLKHFTPSREGTARS